MKIEDIVEFRISHLAILKYFPKRKNKVVILPDSGYETLALDNRT